MIGSIAGSSYAVNNKTTCSFLSNSIANFKLTRNKYLTRH
jgi:hypothetical protein